MQVINISNSLIKLRDLNICVNQYLCLFNIVFFFLMDALLISQKYINNVWLKYQNTNKGAEIFTSCLVLLRWIESQCSYRPPLKREQQIIHKNTVQTKNGKKTCLDKKKKTTTTNIMQ